MTGIDPFLPLASRPLTTIADITHVDDDARMSHPIILQVVQQNRSSYLFRILGPKLIFLIGAAIFGFVLVQGFRTGTIMFHRYPVGRKDEPGGFWIISGFCILAIVCCVFAAAVI